MACVGVLSIRGALRAPCLLAAPLPQRVGAGNIPQGCSDHLGTDAHRRGGRRWDDRCSGRLGGGLPDRVLRAGQRVCELGYTPHELNPLEATYSPSCRQGGFSEVRRSKRPVERGGKHSRAACRTPFGPETR